MVDLSHPEKEMRNMSDVPRSFIEHVESLEQLVKSAVADPKQGEEILRMVEDLVRKMDFGGEWFGCQVGWITVPDDLGLWDE